MTDANPTSSRARVNWITFSVILLGVIVILIWQFRPRGPAPDTVGWRQDYDAALVEAGQTNKPVFAFFTAQWCPACQYMAHDVFPLNDVTALVRDRVVPVKVDLTSSSDAGDALANRFGIQAIPAMLLIDPATGQVIGRQDGGMQAQDFIAWLTTALNPQPAQPRVDDDAASALGS